MTTTTTLSTAHLSPTPPPFVDDTPSPPPSASFTSKGHRFVFRRIDSSDRCDIAELARHTYEGRDWIVHDFDNWLASTDEQVLPVAIVYCGPVVGSAEVDSESAVERAAYVNLVVSIEVSKFLDGGSTSWLCALRVHPAFRGLHLSSHLHSHLIAASQLRPTVRRLRESSHRGNDVSLYLAAKHQMKAVHESAFAWVYQQQHDSRLAWVERQLVKRGIRLADVRLRQLSNDGSGWLSRGSGADLLALRAANPSHPDLRYLLQYWICYEFTADNVGMLTEQPGNAHDVVVSHSSAAATVCEVEAVSLIRSRVDFSSTFQSVTIYATDVTHCLLHLHNALQRQSPHRHDQSAYAPSSIFVPMFFDQAVKAEAEDEQHDALRADLIFVLLERQIEHNTLIK